MKTLKWGIFAYFGTSGDAWLLKGAFEDYDHAMLYALQRQNSNYAIMLLNERGERLLETRGNNTASDPIKWVLYEPEREPEFDGNPLLYGTFTHGQVQMPLAARAADDPESEGYAEFWRTSGFKINPMLT